MKVEEDWFIICDRCGRKIPGAKSRLMWGNGATFRLCGGTYEKKCLKIYNQAITRYTEILNETSK